MSASSSRPLADAPTLLSLSEFKVNFPQDVYSHLSRQYHGDKVTHLESILERMKTPPAETCCRVNLLKASVDEVVDAIKSHLSALNNGEYSVQRHDTLHDIITIRGPSPSSGDALFYLSEPPTAASFIDERFSGWKNRREKGWSTSYRVAIIDRFCGEAVLRGAHIFVKGILSADAGIKEGEEVAVSSWWCLLSLSAN
jgi:hypothetical protein